MLGDRPRVDPATLSKADNEMLFVLAYECRRVGARGTTVGDPGKAGAEAESAPASSETLNLQVTAATKCNRPRAKQVVNIRGKLPEALFVIQDLP